ncbi:hypothetical protein JQ586_33485, partial [Bradyrhizobium jicamae]|nr:hypothetical protein [Bradyrhizobium jicamae]
GPEVMFGSAPLTPGEYGWTPIGAVETSAGYELALKDAATGQYTVWNTDAGGNVIDNAIGNVSASSPLLEVTELSFGQDLNGDGVIGIPGAIESSGATSLVQVGNHYVLDSNSTGTGPEVMFGGAPLAPGEFGWTPTAVAQTSTGYEIALKDTSNGEYTVWNTDTNGNVTYDPLGGNVSGNSVALESLEPSFHHDLNGDGVIGVLVGTSATTNLVQFGDNYFLDGKSTGTGPEVMFGSAPLTPGEYGWTPIGAVETSAGYELALKDAATGQYTVWNTDAGGNVIDNAIGNVSASSPLLEVTELSFGQDLNGDGVIGIPGAIESSGATSLVQVGNHYVLDSNSTGTGPEVTFGGAPLTPGEFGWTVIGAEQTSTGYEIALKYAATGQYTVWYTDSSANVTYDPLGGAVSGNSVALELFESSFHQDLNGDGVIGQAVPAGGALVAPGFASQSVAVTIAGPGNDTFVFHPGIGADTIVSAGAADAFELDGFSVTSNSELATLLHEAQAGQPQSLFQSVNGGHDTSIDLGNHDVITLTDVRLADLHANDFIIR